MSQLFNGIISSMIKAGPYLIPTASIVWVEATAEGGAVVHVTGGDRLALLPDEVPAEWGLLGKRGGGTTQEKKPSETIQRY